MDFAKRARNRVDAAVIYVPSEKIFWKFNKLLLLSQIFFVKLIHIRG